MQMFGKLLEHRSEIVHLVCPYSMQLKSTNWTFGYWVPDVNQIENIDTKVFNYSPTNDQTRIWLMDTGNYEVRYTVRSSTSSVWSNALEAVIEIGEGSGQGQEIERSRTIQSTTRRGSTNTSSTGFTITNPNALSWLRLKIRSMESYSTLFISPESINLTLQRIRPLIKESKK